MAGQNEKKTSGAEDRMSVGDVVFKCRKGALSDTPQKLMSTRK